MKVYLFDTTSGVYQGEDFLDPVELAETEGVTGQAPPPHEAGQVPVYNQAHAAWSLIPAADLKTNGGSHA